MDLVGHNAIRAIPVSVSTIALNRECGASSACTAEDILTVLVGRRLSQNRLVAGLAPGLHGREAAQSQSGRPFLSSLGQETERSPRPAALARRFH
ncbi:MAG: hypothetical protein R3F55_14320 [Alphaproteobacteria bacterium]